MKRPILIATIGYVMGIIWGLYFKTSIVLFHISIYLTYLFIAKIFKNKNRKVKVKVFYLTRYLRYLKIFFTPQLFITIIIFSTISNFIVIFQNNKYEKLYENAENLKGEAIVMSNAKESDYYNTYKIKTVTSYNNKKYKNTYLYLKVKKTENKLKYGEKIFFSGEFIEPSIQKNDGGFNDKEYLKTAKVYGRVKATEVKVIREKSIFIGLYYANQISNLISKKIDSNFQTKEGALIKGFLIGDTSDMEEELEEKFRITNISHVLAVSGMHVAYIVIGIELLTKETFGKRKMRIFMIILLICYCALTGFNPSIVRATIMGILALLAKLLYRKNDTITSLALSLFIILIYNPFLILHLGLQLSYLGTLGILIFKDFVDYYLEKIKIKNPKWKYRFSKKVKKIFQLVKESVSITISAQLLILPVIIYSTNLFGTYFLISNLLVSFIVAPIMLFSIITVVFLFIIPKGAILISKILAIILSLLIAISDLSQLPFAKIYIKTPSIFAICLYYLLLIILYFMYLIYNPNNSKIAIMTQRRFKNFIAYYKFKIKSQKSRIISVFLLIVLAFTILAIIPKKLEIYFVDVGQGDCTFITTPKNQTILIDGGGSDTSYNVGKSTLLPFILDKGYTSVDYIFISHFDQDHVDSILTLLEEIKIRNIIIGKQFEDSDNYRKFIELVKEKKVEVNVVEAGTCINIEKNLFFEILWPNSDNIVSENVINNNSLVCKLNYKKFSMFFTGDIEEKAEEAIYKIYEKTNILKSTVLKVAHHGSKTSSTKKFLEVVQPKVALIGVGERNNFGHPNSEVLERIEKLKTKIYRTDENGQITITVNKNGQIKLRKNV